MTPSHPERPFPSASLLLLSIFLALVIQSALDSFLNVVLASETARNPLDTDAVWSGLHNEVTLLRYAQMTALLVLLARFYLGAFRFNSETSSQKATTKASTAFIDNLVDFSGTALLFIAFYALSKTVASTGDFYLITAILHGFDALWFVAVIGLLLKQTPLLAVARWYIVWDVVTIAWFVFAALILGTERSDFLLQWILLLGLLSVSILDWWFLRKFYFWPEQWRVKALA